MSQSFPAIFGTHGESQAPPTFVGKVVLWIAVLVSLVLMYWFASTFAIPAEPGFSASLIQQNAWLISFVVTIIGMVVVMFASATLTSALRTDSPVFCTAIACAIISWRGGTMQSTLFDSSTPRIFIALAVETIILFAALIGAWMILCKARGPRPAVAVSSDPEAEGGLDEKLLATFTQAAAMMAMMILLCRSDAKNQVLASVGISAAVGSAIAVQMVKVRSSFWLWIGPVAVAVFGYLFSTFHAEGWQVGLLHGPLAALARPLPLDYLSMGPAGAIFGYWLSGGGDVEEELPDVDAPVS
jgi:hypothetical protein